MPQIPSSSSRFATLTLVGSALGVALFSAHMWAATKATLPNIALDVKQTQTKSETTNSADQQQSNGNGNGKGGKGGMGGGQNISSRTSEIYYIITVYNNSNAPASNVEVDYTIYNTTHVNSNGKSSANTDPITGSETVDIPANSSKDIETSKVPHLQQQASNTNSGGGGKKGSSNNGGNKQPKSTTTQSIDGIWVQAKIGDAVVAGYEKPMDIKKKMEAKAKGGSSSSLDSMDSSF